MAKVTATEIRAGNLIEWEKRVWRVLKSYHVHVGGRGGAFMQVEMKDIESGTKKNERIRTEDKIERAFVDQRNMQYLYSDGSGHVFMDKESFEQLTLDADFLEGQAGYLIPNIDVQVNFYQERPIGVQLPPSVVADRHRDRAQPQERDRDRLVQAGEDRDRPHRHGAPVHRRRHEDQGQYRHRRVHRAA